MPIRSHAIEASAASEAGYVPHRGLGPCGPCRKRRGSARRGRVAESEEPF
jgi:hypothetical protein